MSAVTITIILVAFLCLIYANSLKDELLGRTVFVPPGENHLPVNIKPINYKIHLAHYLNETEYHQFYGECFIEIQAATNTTEIPLHLIKLILTSAEYYRKDDANQKNELSTRSYNYSTHIMHFNLNEALQAHVSYILHFKYMGFMNEDSRGFYRRSYTTSQNESKYVAATNFERSYARRVLPCFDEPNFKATFDLSLTHHRSLRSIGPTRLSDTSSNGEYVTDVYATTPKMSISSLGFLLSEFSERSDGYFSVLARTEYYTQTEYIFDLGKASLKALSEYLAIPYYSMGNDKLQFALIPGLPISSTENWGLITFPETSFLNDDKYNTVGSKQNAVWNMTRAQSLMWFGGLVTPNRWTLPWLKDGFGTYFGYVGGHMVDSSFRLDHQFVIDIQQNAMIWDAELNSFALTEENIESLRYVYNKPAFLKAASFIRMTRHILGGENFRMSLIEYLETHQYGNIVPLNLLAVWKKYWPKQCLKYADRFFNSFTTQVGFPVVTFNRISESKIEISQKRFVLQEFGDGVSQNLVYTVPISFTTNMARDFENTSLKVFLEKSPFQIIVNSDTKWIMGNIQATGYYRVNYDSNNWRQIKQALYSENWGGIHELNRAQMVDDLFNFARAGEIDYSLALDVLEYLETETNYLPWAAAFHGFTDLIARLGNETGDFPLYLYVITKKVYTKLGFEEREEDTSLDIYNRALVLDWSCKFGNTDCISKAKTYFNKNLLGNPVPLNIRSLVYCVAMREGNVEDFEKLYSMYQTETVASERKMILLSFGCVKDNTLISIVFHMILSAKVDPLHKTDAIKSLFSKNSENVEPVFVLIENNFEQLVKSVNIENVMYEIAYYLTTKDQLARLRDLDKKYRKGFRTFHEALSRCRLLFEWSDAIKEPIKTFFEQYKTKRICDISNMICYLLPSSLIVSISNYEF